MGLVGCYEMAMGGPVCNHQGKGVPGSTWDCSVGSSQIINAYFFLVEDVFEKP